MTDGKDIRKRMKLLHEMERRIYKSFIYISSIRVKM